VRVDRPRLYGHPRSLRRTSASQISSAPVSPHPSGCFSNIQVIA
jgi:hypothetical protein